MTKQRAVILVTIDLDPVPGTYHTPEDYVNYFSEHLKGAAHYNPRIKLIDVIDSDNHKYDSIAAHYAINTKGE